MNTWTRDVAYILTIYWNICVGAFEIDDSNVGGEEKSQWITKLLCQPYRRSSRLCRLRRHCHDQYVIVIVIVLIVTSSSLPHSSRPSFKLI